MDHKTPRILGAPINRSTAIDGVYWPALIFRIETKWSLNMRKLSFSRYNAQRCRNWSFLQIETADQSIVIYCWLSFTGYSAGLTPSWCT